MPPRENPPSERFTPFLEQRLVECVACGLLRKPDEFYTDSRSGKPMGTCKVCLSERGKQQRARVRNGPHKIVHEKYCPRCDDTLPALMFSPNLSIPDGLSGWCKPCARAARAESKLKFKHEAMSKYGGECACCGERGLDFLTLDHEGGGGAEHRKNQGVGTGDKFYAYLRRNAYPEEIDGYRIRVLCFNCNYSMHLNGGKCLHQTSFEEAYGDE